MAMDLILGRQRLTVDGTARSPTIPDGTRKALVSVEEAPLRYTFEGTTPVAGATTVGQGHLAADGDVFIFGIEELKGLKMIRNTGTSGYVEFTYYKY